MTKYSVIGAGTKTVEQKHYSIDNNGYRIRDTNGEYLTERHLDLFYYLLFIYDNTNNLYFEICINEGIDYYRQDIKITIVPSEEIFSRIKYVPIFELVFDDNNICLDTYDEYDNFFYNYINDNVETAYVDEYFKIFLWVDNNTKKDVFLLDYSLKDDDGDFSHHIPTAFLNLTFFNDLSEHRIMNKTIHEELVSIVHHPFNLGYSYYLDNNCAYTDEEDDEILSTSLKVYDVLRDIRPRIALFNTL